MRILALILFLSSWVSAQETFTTSPKGKTIDAAFRYNGYLYLISGDEYMRISAKGNEMYTRLRVGDSQVPITSELQAAVAWPLKPLVHFYDAEFSYKNNQTSMESVPHHYGRYREFLQKGGPDAAAFKSGQFYIFRGCQFVAQRATLWKLGQPQPISGLGLPCDIDAAWTDEDTRGMTILKGNQIWRWREGSDVEGPTRFDDTYTIFSWSLASVEDDVFHL